jgi:hypothetical protein
MKEQKYFYGFPVSDYGAEHGFVDYATLWKVCGALRCNDIVSLFYATLNGDYIEPELYNGEDIEQEDENEGAIYKEFYQYYIVTEYGAEILKRHTNEVVYYLECLDMYIWAIDHFGTSWAYVLTEIEI